MSGLVRDRPLCDNVPRRACVDLVERSGTSRGRGGTTVELNAHIKNKDGIDFYEHLGFATTGTVNGGLARVMRRRQA